MQISLCNRYIVRVIWHNSSLLDSERIFFYMAHKYFYILNVQQNEEKLSVVTLFIFEWYQIISWVGVIQALISYNQALNACLYRIHLYHAYHKGKSINTKHRFHGYQEKLIKDSKFELVILYEKSMSLYRLIGNNQNTYSEMIWGFFNYEQKINWVEQNSGDPANLNRKIPSECENFVDNGNFYSKE